MDSLMWPLIHAVALLTQIVCLAIVQNDHAAVRMKEKVTTEELQLALNFLLLFGMFFLHLLFWAQETSVVNIFPPEKFALWSVKVILGTPLISIALTIYGKRLGKKSLAS